MIQLRSVIGWGRVAIVLLVAVGSIQAAVRTAADLQVLLDRRLDLVLTSGEVVEVEQTLQLNSAGQANYTEGVKSPLEFGTVRHARGSAGTLIDGCGKAGVRILELILNSSRSEFYQAEGKLYSVPMISPGGEGSDRHEIRRCIVVNVRWAGGWGANHVQEGGEFIIEGHRSEPGIGDGLPRIPTDESAAFLYNPVAVGKSERQSEFRPSKWPVSKVLRSGRGGSIPTDPLGYRDLGFGPEEAMAVVEGVYLEIWGLGPSEQEATQWTGWLTVTGAIADLRRSQLMSTPEFSARFGYVYPLEMNRWRGERRVKFIRSISSDLQKKSGYLALGV